MRKKTKLMVDFFKHDSVKLTVPFPISCFKNDIWNNLKPFKFDALIKGQKRDVVFLGKNYNDFLTHNNVFKFLKSFRKIKSYKANNGCFSYTDIYELNKIKNFKEKFNNNKSSYSQEMYGYWKIFKKRANELNKQYKYHAYIDIQSYYDSVYTHFLYGIQTKNINKFLEFEENHNVKEWKEKNTKEWCNIFFKAFESKISYCRQSHTLAIGNGISDFLAELYNKLIDFFTMPKKIGKLTIIRFRDDIYIFGNEEETINKLYRKYQSILNKLHLHINEAKSYEATEEKIEFYEKEEEYRNLLKNKKHTYLQISKMFTVKYPKSNLIFDLLKKVYQNNEVKIKQHVKSLSEIFNKSRTNVLPLILSIIDKIKKDKKKMFYFFWNDISKKDLSESDWIWILCFKWKNQIEIQSDIGNNNFNQSFKKLMSFLKDNNKEINLYYDADKWSYGEIKTLSH